MGKKDYRICECLLVSSLISHQLLSSLRCEILVSNLPPFRVLGAEFLLLSYFMSFCCPFLEVLSKRVREKQIIAITSMNITPALYPTPESPTTVKKTIAVKKLLHSQKIPVDNEGSTGNEQSTPSSRLIGSNPIRKIRTIPAYNRWREVRLAGEK